MPPTACRRLQDILSTLQQDYLPWQDIWRPVTLVCISSASCQGQHAWTTCIRRHPKMTILTFMRNLCKSKITSSIVLHEPAIEENIESSLPNASNDVTIADDTKDKSKRLSYRSTGGSLGISSPSHVLPRTPFNTPKKKKLRRSIRDHILGDNGTVVFVNEIIPSSPTPDCPPSNIATGTSDLPPIYAAQMGLQSPPPADQAFEFRASSAGGPSSVNPGHEALNVLNQLSRASNLLPTSTSLMSRSAELQCRAVSDQSQSYRAASATTFRTTGATPVLSRGEHHSPARADGAWSTGQFGLQYPPGPPSSPTAHCICAPSISNPSLPKSQGSASIRPTVDELEVYIDNILHDESVEECRHQTVICQDAAGDNQAGPHARVHLDVYDRLWLDAQRRKDHESTCCCSGAS